MTNIERRDVLKSMLGAGVASQLTVIPVHDLEPEDVIIFQADDLPDAMIDKLKDGLLKIFDPAQVIIMSPKMDISIIRRVKK